MTFTRLDVYEASTHMLAQARALPDESVALDDALGRVLSQSVRSEVFLPTCDNASMDGFAVRAADVAGARLEHPVVLRLVGTVAAGGRALTAVEAGTAVRIMTGAPVPPGADSVVRVEDTASDADAVTIRGDRDALRNIRRRGEDIRAGEEVLGIGSPIGAAQLGVLASIGCGAPSVYRQPRVAILATGDELVMVDQFDQVRSGDRIVSSNSHALAAAVREAGGIPVPLGIARDTPDDIARCLGAAEGCDMVLTCGGVSVGDFDFTRRVVTSLGGELSLWRIRMRPGAPLAFGSLFGVPWLGLPGNPVSALVTFELFGRPLLRTLAGHARPHRRTIAVATGEQISLGAPLTHFLRVVLEDDGDATVRRAHLTGAQSSGMLTSMSRAHALLVVPPEPQSVAAGTILRALPLEGDLGGSLSFLQ